ncbi:MAG: glycine--tRNA ligase subunit beta [Clostridia bacterium]
MRHFLLEMGVEEIPTAYLGVLTDELGSAVRAGLLSRRLPSEELHAAGTPRRLAVYGRVAERQQAARRRVKGPPLERARGSDGAYTPAAEGFARRLGIPVAALEVGEGTDAGYVVATVDEPETAVEELLPALLEEAMASLHPARNMRWANDDTRFIRPVRWLVALLDDAVLPVTAFGLRADRTSYGNRTDYPGPFAIAHARTYSEELKARHVELHHADRTRRIRERGVELAGEVHGTLALYPGLLDEVADLVEWPVPFRGTFDAAALTVPAEILETAMVHHQRYFPVMSGPNTLHHAFVGVRNGEGIDLSGVIRGNEKVLSARLADARFFYDEDLGVRLESRVADLDRVVFHQALGTLGDKRRRMEEIAGALAAPLGLSEGARADLLRAAALAKTDLLTHVVGEFPELQGTMGGVYAVIQGEPPAVADALRGQYHPAGPDDDLPDGVVSQALALVDRLDTLAGMQARGLLPTGSEDPFGFRRQGLGLARLLMEGELAAVQVRELLAVAFSVWEAHDLGLVDALLEFLRARLRGYLTARARTDVVDAVLHGEAPWGTLKARLDELTRRIAEGDFDAMAVTFKRVKNLTAGVAPHLHDQYPQPDEAALHAALAQALAEDQGDAGDRRYWDRVTALYEPVADFFDRVLVMDPDPVVRQRRLGLLAAVGEFLGRGADLSRITGERGKA